MKVVISTCYGGFGLSPRATKRYAELKGRGCWFFALPIVDGRFSRTWQPLTLEEAEKEYMWFAFDVPNPNEVVPDRGHEWHTLTHAERAAANALSDKHGIDHGRELVRHDPDLVRVVEELGDAASGKHAELKVVEIPDGVEYVVDEYDGRESIHEAHRSWA